MLADLRQRDTIPLGAKILIVDDDVRTIFALTTVLERYHIEVLHADSGSAGIQMLENTPDIDCVLMDVMMPEMDGYETMQVIRQNPSFRRLPIIALTAKAMKGDREKCLEAGASEYLAKPVNTEQLLSALRMWLHR
jgi:CheY-like chemotaxis protein